MNNIAKSHQIKTVFVEKTVKHYQWVDELLDYFINNGAAIIEIDDAKLMIEEYSDFPYPINNYGFDKLLLARQKGSFYRPCPCSPKTIRCGYYFLSVGLGCPIDCSYCFLQGFLNTSFPVLYVNFDDLEQELNLLEKEMSNKNKYLRIGTGEMTDSLVFEPITNYAKYIAKLFKMTTIFG